MPRCVPSLTLWSISWKWWITPILRPLIPPPSERRVIRDRPVGAGGVARIVAGERLQHQRAILGGPRHRADMVEAEGGRRDAGAADETVGRLEPGDAAKGRRAADRAAGVGADAAEDQPGRDRRRRCRCCCRR